jgi:hypothetical protein
MLHPSGCAKQRRCTNWRLDGSSLQSRGTSMVSRLSSGIPDVCIRKCGTVVRRNSAGSSGKHFATEPFKARRRGCYGRLGMQFQRFLQVGQRLFFGLSLAGRLEGAAHEPVVLTPHRAANVRFMYYVCNLRNNALPHRIQHDLRRAMQPELHHVRPMCLQRRSTQINKFATCLFDRPSARSCKISFSRSVSRS